MKKISASSVLSLLAFCALPALTGCSNSSRDAQVVQAQQIYSNAAMNGAYVFTYLGYNLGNSGNVSAATGTVQFDGNGNVSSGTLNAQVGGGQTCQYTTKGTYSIQSSGSGTATLNLTAADPTCSTNPFTISMTVAQSGAAFVFTVSGNGATGQLSGSAFKQ